MHEKWHAKTFMNISSKDTNWTGESEFNWFPETVWTDSQKNSFNTNVSDAIKILLLLKCLNGQIKSSLKPLQYFILIFDNTVAAKSNIVNIQ